VPDGDAGTCVVASLVATSPIPVGWPMGAREQAHKFLEGLRRMGAFPHHEAAGRAEGGEHRFMTVAGASGCFGERAVKTGAFCASRKVECCS